MPILAVDASKKSVLRHSSTLSGKILSNQPRKPATRCANHTSTPGTRTRRGLLVTGQGGDRNRPLVQAGSSGSIADRCSSARKALRPPKAALYAQGLCATAVSGRPVAARGEWCGLLAVLIMFAVVWRKLQHEERWMGEAFGEDYAKYRSEVYALIPFVL